MWDADQGGGSGQGMCEETIKNCWVRGSESAWGAAEENAGVGGGDRFVSVKWQETMICFG